MIDRAARDEAIDVIECYLDDRITAFEFDERLQCIETNDETVNAVVLEAWFHYDDCKDHQVVLSKEGWDWFQRMLLLLRSDVEFVTTKSRRWSWDHRLALIATMAFVPFAIRVGWSPWLLVGSILLGILSLAIATYRRGSEAVPTAQERACAPFDSFGEMRWLRREVPGFVKRRYRKEIAGRRIRSKVAVSVSGGLSYALWFFFAPVVLLFQALPSVNSVTNRLVRP